MSDDVVFTGPVLAEDRRNQILELLYTNRFVRTRDLQVQFDVSDVTLRSDLQELEKRGRLVRTRGGAVLSSSDRTTSTFEARLLRNGDAKQRIAVAASQFLHGESTVIFDAGTTILALAHHIPPVSQLTVLTPGLGTAQHLLSVDGVDVIVFGGPVDKDTRSTTWPLASVSDTTGLAHTAFMGVHGIDADLDMVDCSRPVADAKRRLLTAARRVILLADSSKIGIEAPVKVAPLANVDVLITDDKVPLAFAQEIRDIGVELVVV